MSAGGMQVIWDDRVEESSCPHQHVDVSAER